MKKNQDAFAPKQTLKESFQELTSAKGVRLGGYSAISIIIVLVIAVVLNLAVGKLPSTLTQLDTSKDQLSAISAQTKETVANLNQDITLYWIVQEGSEDPTLELLVSRYTDLSDHIKLVKIDPVVSPNFASQYTTAQIYNNSFIAVCGERSQYVSYYDLYVTDYSNYYTTGETSTEFYGESCLTGAVAYVTSETLPKMYLLDGHGSITVPSNIKSMITKQNIETVNLNLLTDGVVPEDCDVLMIFAPQTDLSKEEAAAIGDYLAAGGKMMLVTGYVDTELKNLNAVMADYGTQLKDGIVFEGSANNYYQYPYLHLPNIESHTITAPIESGYYVMYPEPQAIAQVDAKSGTVAVTPLLTTSSTAYIKTDVASATTYEKSEEDEEGKFMLAAAITDSASDSQIVWFTSTLFCQTTYDEAVGGTNSDLFLNALSWMCQSENNITIHAKTISTEYLTVPATSVALLALMMIAVLPIGCIVIGIYVAIGRRKR